ncbi:MAG: hypothetical protein OXH00_13675 [Candidatus Poribacteria bacterium]|nr:hypothetical protein [Candidatus Poribacteria bacterium]
MKLDEKHKQFAVKYFARFMTRAEVVEAFLEEFADDLPPPPEFEEFTQEEFMEVYEGETLEAKRKRDEEVAEILEEYKEDYSQMYGADANTKFEEDRDTLQEKIRQDWYTKDYRSFYRECRLDHQAEVEEHFEETKQEISNQLRRFNITHPRFPNKYRDLFNQTREQYFNEYRGESLGISENVLRELEILLGYAKQCIFQEKKQTDAMKFITLAHQILKTTVAHNAVSEKQDVVDITPQSVKALADSQKVLTDQLKEVTQQLTDK